MTRSEVAKCAECGTPFVPLGANTTSRCPMCERIAPGPGRRRGIVKWYSRGKGYGFITAIDGADVFLHKSGLRDEQAPRAGQLVEFAVGHGPRGAQAMQVEVLSAHPTEDAGPGQD